MKENGCQQTDSDERILGHGETNYGTKLALLDPSTPIKTRIYGSGHSYAPVRCYICTMLFPRHLIIIPSLAFSLISGAQNTWNSEPYVTDSALIFHDDLDFYLNGYTRLELRMMRNQVNLMKMSFNKVMKEQVNDVRAFSEGRTNATETQHFSLKTTTGDRINTKDGTGKIRAFMFGSITNPPAIAQMPLWSELAEKYDTSKVQLFVVYARELHPGDRKFKDYKWPESETEKMAYAKEFAELGSIPVAVDGLNNRVLDMYGRVPNSAFVIDQNGVLVFRATWADSRKIEVVVDKLLEWDRDKHLNDSSNQ